MLIPRDWSCFRISLKCPKRSHFTEFLSHQASLLKYTASIDLVEFKSQWPLHLGFLWWTAVFWAQIVLNLLWCMWVFPLLDPWLCTEYKSKCIFVFLVNYSARYRDLKTPLIIKQCYQLLSTRQASIQMYGHWQFADNKGNWSSHVNDWNDAFVLIQPDLISQTSVWAFCSFVIILLKLLKGLLCTWLLLHRALYNVQFKEDFSAQGSTAL